MTPLPLRPAPAGFLPNLFILGAAKCATATLHAYLERIDGVCMSHPKEPVFFLNRSSILGWHIIGGVISRTGGERRSSVRRGSEIFTCRLCRNAFTRSTLAPA
ncbi:hypothetical protein QQ056_10945 [Oscillatoria laete-virens NRMC-F 0139]|nr:hypothetical protein [Oscillatoria laete-virens]MDL5054056.1 hypothetical protein [Oscillatoria laete-virens NRMC-F 0139]